MWFSCVIGCKYFLVSSFSFQELKTTLRIDSLTFNKCSNSSNLVKLNLNNVTTSSFRSYYTPTVRSFQTPLMQRHKSAL